MAVWQVEVEDRGSVGCRPGEDVLRAVQRQWAPLVRVGCRGGGCGICKVRVLSGTYEVGPQSRRHVTVEEEAEGYALACRLLPTSDLVVRAVQPISEKIKLPWQSSGS